MMSLFNPFRHFAHSDANLSRSNAYRAAQAILAGDLYEERDQAYAFPTLRPLTGDQATAHFGLLHYLLFAPLVHVVCAYLRKKLSAAMANPERPRIHRLAAFGVAFTKGFDQWYLAVTSAVSWALGSLFAYPATPLAHYAHQFFISESVANIQVSYVPPTPRESASSNDSLDTLMVHDIPSVLHQKRAHRSETARKSWDRDTVEIRVPLAKKRQSMS